MGRRAEGTYGCGDNTCRIGGQAVANVLFLYYLVLGLAQLCSREILRRGRVPLAQLT